MAYVRKAEFVEQQKEARPETKIEAQVTQLLDAAGNAGSFRAALYRDGLIIARVDEQGIVGLEREFKDRERERSLKDDQGPSRHMPTFTVGEVVAVNQLGHVHKLSAYKVDLNRVENALGTLPAMSETRDFLMRDHAAGKQQRADAWADKRTRNEQVQKDRADRKELLRDIYRPVDRSDRAPPPDPVTPALQVADKATGKVMGLMAFAAKLLETPKPPPTPAEQIIANRKALAAMQVLRDEIRRERGEGLSAADVKALPEAVLKGIALLGDDYLRKQIERMDYEQQRRRDDYGRTRER
jgi:hypothetical protein